MINPEHFRLYAIRPTLKALEPHIPYSLAAEELLLGTAVQESLLTYLVQLGDGPARGVYQIEPATHDDVYRNYLSYRPDLEKHVRDLAGRGANLHGELVTNMAYATAIARLVYWRAKDPLPEAEDIEGMGAYYKKFFNTPLGKGSAEQFVGHYQEFVQGL